MAVVDVVIPTRNRFDLTLAATRSVQAQTFADWALWIVDDGSDDGSDADLALALRDDPRITVISGPRMGPEAARRCGAEQGSAPWVAPLDSDDLWVPTKLERQLAVASVADIVMSWYQWVRPDGTVRSVGRPQAEGRFNPLLTNNMSAPLVRRDILDVAGGLGRQGSKRYLTCDNIDLWTRLSGVANMRVVDEVLVHCRDHTGPRSSDSNESMRGALELDDLITQHEAILKRWPSDQAALFARAGARYLAAGAKGEGVDRLRTALRIGPGDTRLRIARQYGPFAIRALLRRG